MDPSMLRTLLAALFVVIGSTVGAQTAVPQTQAEILLGFAPVVKKAAPAVVNIYAKIITQAHQSPFVGDPFFEDFFRSFGPPQPRVQNSLGSGVILSEDGIVVSNYHVVGMATDIRVVLSDRREFSARVLLGDKSADLAILQLDGAEDLPFLALRNSDEVAVGELALAIGNPFGVGQTVTSGIISGLARSGAATGNARGYFLQTDAPINPGNSGGALVDVNANLIGINTSILSRSGGSNGIGFAIPANLVAEFVSQAQAGNQEFERPWAGLAGQPVNADLAGSLGLTVPEGVLISEIHPQSPFAAAGIKVGDVITSVDGKPVNSPSEMLFRMTVAGVGNQARVTRRNATGEEDIAVVMMAPPNDPPAQEVKLDNHTMLPGLTVVRINPAIIARYGLPLTLEGVLVTDPGPVGQRIGLRSGDVVLSVNGNVPASGEDVRKSFTDPPRRNQIDVLRRGQRVSLRFRR